MKKLLLWATLSVFFVGCGSSGGFRSSTEPGLQQEGNFITTTVEVEQRYLYTLNSGDGTVGAFVFPAGEEGEGHGHAHGRALAQEVEEEEGPEAVELDPSPFNLGHAPIDIGVLADSFLVTLDASGVVRTYLIDGVTGLLEFQSELNTNTANPRRLIVSEEAVAVLGDQLRIYTLNSSGNLSAPAFLDGTSTWVDVELDGQVGAASTADGAAGFSWQTGNSIDPVFSLALPGVVRGELVYAELGLFVLNGEDGSLSLLSQEATGELVLQETFALGGDLVTPTLITGVFDGQDLLVADADSVTLLHPEPGALEDEGSAVLPREPSRLFFLPESEAVYAGHATGDGSTTILIEETGPEVLDEAGPGGSAPTGFGYAERLELITETLTP